MTPPSTTETQAAQAPNPIIDKIDASPPADRPSPQPSNDAIQEGTPIEVWRSGQWLLATYLQPLSNSVFSHLTQRLDDGHEVQFHQTNLPQRVATADLRILQT